MKAEHVLSLHAFDHASYGSLFLVHDADLVRQTRMPISDLRDNLESTEQEGLVERFRVENPVGFNVLITARSRL